MGKTEKPSLAHTRLDEYPTPELVAVLIEDQDAAVKAVRAAAPQLAAAVTAALPRIEAGGRLVYVGAGTSGRLGLLDSVELCPTFSWPVARAIALLAGGRDAAFQSAEGAEDSREQGAAAVTGAQVGALDVVLLISASGTTPSTLGALHAARAGGALTIGIVNNPGAAIAVDADISITLDTGAELISGSTRLKAGTAQKVALNAFSTALMVRLNKVYRNLMVDVQPTNAKLVRRTVMLTMHATGADEPTAMTALEACDHHVKAAIVMILLQTGVADARRRLDAAGGSVHGALAK